MKFQHVQVLVLFVLLFGLAAGDLDQDKKKCTYQLIVLAKCFPYLSGEAIAPPVGCCAGFKQVVANSFECVCFLVKYRDDPSLGLHINVTGVLGLPSQCKLADSRSISDCSGTLHLPPSPPNSTTVPAPDANAEINGGGKVGKGWLGPCLITMVVVVQFRLVK